jgi:hypothetical protein
MTKPTEKVYLKKFYIAIGIVVRSRRFFKKNLGMGDRASPRACRSSATPPPGAARCMARINAGTPQAREANEAQQNRTTVLFYGIERPCFFVSAGALSI